MIRWALLVVAIVAAGWFATHVAKAEPGQPASPQQETIVQPLPVVCMRSHTFSEKVSQGQFYSVWQGLNGHTYLTTLWKMIGQKGWIITVQVAGSDLICIVAGGDQQGEVGEEADAAS